MTQCKSRHDPGIYKHNPRLHSAYSLSYTYRKIAHVYSNLTSAYMRCAHSLHTHVRVSVRGGARSRACMQAWIQIRVSLYTHKETYKPEISEILNHESLQMCTDFEKVVSDCASRFIMGLFCGDVGLLFTSSIFQIGHFLDHIGRHTHNTLDMHTYLQTRHHSSPRCIMGLFCGDIGVFYGYTFLCTHASTLDLYKHSRTYTLYRRNVIKTTWIYTHHTHLSVCVYGCIFLDEEIPRWMYPLPDVEFPTVVVGRGVDV